MLNVVYEIAGVVLMSGSYRVINRLAPEANFPEELRKGNVAVAIFIAAIFVRQAVTDRYDDTSRMYAKRYFGPGFDWRIFKAQAMAESRLDPNAKSWVGTRGLMQLMPMTSAEVQSKNPEIGQIDDPAWDIAAGIFYDRQLWQQWSADYRRSAAVQVRLLQRLAGYAAARADGGA